MHFKTFVVFFAACFLAAAQPPQRETIAKPLSEKEKKKRDQGLRKELSAYDSLGKDRRRVYHHRRGAGGISPSFE